MAHCFFAVEHFDSKFVELITKLSMCNTFFTNRWLPNVFVDMIATNSRNKLKYLHLVLLLNKQTLIYHSRPSPNVSKAHSVATQCNAWFLSFKQSTKQNTKQNLSLLVSLPWMKTEDFLDSTLDLFWVFSGRTFFPKLIWVAKLGMLLMCECSLYTAVYGIS